MIKKPIEFHIEPYTVNGIDVYVDPKNRNRYLDALLSLEGLSHIEENPHAAYCPISLTSTPNELKPILKERQQVLMREILDTVGITAYDPASAPFSPDLALTKQPNEIYLVDSGKIAGARFFVGHNILPSTGQGVEAEKAKQLNRIVVMLMDKRVRVSRMQPHRAIYLQYEDFAKQKDDFVSVFTLLKEYQPGFGFENGVPVLLGFDRQGKPVNLETLIYETFPTLQYYFDGNVPTLAFTTNNPELLV